MNNDSVTNTPLAKAILEALVGSRAGRNYYDDTRLILRVLDKHRDVAASDTTRGDEPDGK